MNRWEQEEAEQKAYEAHMQTMYDEQQREQQLSEQVTWLQEEVERLKAENEVLRGERAAVVAWLEKAGHMPSTVEVFRRGEHRRVESKP